MPFNFSKADLKKIQEIADKDWSMTGPLPEVWHCIICGQVITDQEYRSGHTETCLAKQRAQKLDQYVDAAWERNR